jgi:hypothetical protein
MEGQTVSFYSHGDRRLAGIANVRYIAGQLSGKYWQHEGFVYDTT